MHQTTVTLRPQVAEVSRARHRVASFCGGLPEDLRTIAQLLTSELVTNAVEHSAEAVNVHLTLARSGLRVEVTDRSSSLPRRKESTERDERGRGLMIVESLASTWGVQPNSNGPGKTVWFTLRTR